MLIALPTGWLMLLGGMLTLHWIYTVGLHALLCWPHSICQIRLTLNQHGQLECQVKDHRNRWFKATIDEDSLITPPLTLLSLKTNPRAWHRRLVLLTGDNCDRESYRRLRVLMRYAPSDNQACQ